MKTSYKITGSDAIRLAERDCLTLQCYANPLDDGGVINPGVARQIAKEDPSLIYVEVVPCGWIDDDRHPVSHLPGYAVEYYFNAQGMYLGADDGGVEPRWSDYV